jgi:hypothetical protein
VSLNPLINVDTGGGIRTVLYHMYSNTSMDNHFTNLKARPDNERDPVYILSNTSL